MLGLDSKSSASSVLQALKPRSVSPPSQGRGPSVSVLELRGSGQLLRPLAHVSWPLLQGANDPGAG